MSGNILYTPALDIEIEPGMGAVLKLENRQHTGSFKARGSLNKILKIAASNPSASVITASTGNHALGVARALEITGLKGTIVLPRNAAAYKIRKLEAYRVALKFVEGSSLDAELAAKKASAHTGDLWISPYNDPDIIAGQGTIGLEILEQVPGADAIFITVGGGGLVSGVAGVLKHLKPGIDVFGCQPANSPEMKLSVEAGHIVEFPDTPTLSDGSAGGIEPAAITFPVCRQVIDAFCLASESEIRDSIRIIFEKSGEVIEGAAGVAVACAKKMLSVRGYRHPVIIICGGNIEEKTFKSIVSK